MDGNPPDGCLPKITANKMITNNHVNADEALKTPQFWLLWVMLMVNVTAGIGILSQASPMIQEMFPGSVTPESAAFFVALLSFFNLIGRFLWSSFSDKIGRKVVYGIYFWFRTDPVRRRTIAGLTEHRVLVYCGLCGDYDHVWRGLCHHSGVPARLIWHVSGGGQFTAGCSRPGQQPASSDRCW